MVGRKEEIEILNKLLTSKQPEMLAVTGIRRVGKTFLIRETLKSKIDFEIVGLKNGAVNLQLQNFHLQLARTFNDMDFDSPAKNWLEAFENLIQCLQTLPKSKKAVLFFDEFPWLDSQKSGFKTAFAHFWNSYASRNNVLVIICGSAATYMIEKVLNDKGGLHNRVTQYINSNLSPSRKLNYF